MYGSQENIKHNLKMFFIDGIVFTPSMVLISITAVIPYFLDQLGATTFQIALASSMTMICAFLTQPFFGYIASKSTVMNKTFSKILLVQRLSFLLFALLIPVFAGSDSRLITMFLIFWCVFCLFTGSYSVFYTPLILKLLPPNKRGTIRGIGFAIGAFLGVGMSALIPIIISNITFPYNYMIIFVIGSIFLFLSALTFNFMRQPEDMPPNEPMSMTQYLKQMPSTVRESPPFRAVIFTCIFMTISNALLPYYTLKAIRVFSATETHVALFAGLAIITTAVAYIGLGYIVDRWGPRIVALIVAVFIFLAGAIVLATNSLSFLIVGWICANFAFNGTMLSTSLLIGEVSPTSKMPLYVGVLFTISMSISAGIVLLMAPVLEAFGFAPVFTLVLLCGLLSFSVNNFILRKLLAKKVSQEVS